MWELLIVYYIVCLNLILIFLFVCSCKYVMVISDVIYIEYRGFFFFNNVCSLMSLRSFNFFYLFKLIFLRKLNVLNYFEGVFLYVSKFGYW